MKRRSFKVILVLCISLALAACRNAADPSPTPASSELLAITNGLLIDGTGAPAVEDGLVLIKGNKIFQVGSASGIELPEETQVIDVRGSSILPGFIDSHVHGAANPAVRQEFLAGGITTVCDLGSTLAEMPRFETTTYEGQLIARVYNSGQIMTVPGGAPDAIFQIDYNYEVTSADSARQGVRELIEKGADMIKAYLEPGTGEEPMPMLDEDQLKAIVDEAHKADVLVHAHVTNIDDLPIALAAGVDVIEHVPWYTRSAAILEILANSENPEQELMDLLLSKGEPALFEQMAEEGVGLTPTLYRLIGDAYLQSDLAPLEQSATEAYLADLGFFHRQGGMVSMGTDFNIDVGLEPGISIGELELMMAAGLTPMEVIVASTRNAAVACGQGESLGTLEVGKLADLIVVDGDPLADVAMLSNVSMVVIDGQVVEENP